MLRSVDKVSRMTTIPSFSAAYEGRISRKVSNSLELQLRDTTGETIGTAIQNGAGGGGGKLATLFGFKNGGTGRHLLTYADGSSLIVESRDAEPTLLSRDDRPVATITRGETSTATLPDGTAVFRFAADPVAPKDLDLFRIVVTDPAGATVGRLSVVRRNTGWELARGLDAILWDAVLWEQTGKALPIPILGTQLVTTTELVGTDRDILLGVCVDIAIGLRPYFTGMG
jgi:hypothetical protein